MTTITNSLNLIGGLPVTVAEGGTGNSTVTAYMPIVGGTTTTGNLQSVATGSTTGQVLTYQGASALPTWSTITGSSWVDQTSTTVTMVVNTNYVADNASLVTLTLPATAALGSTFIVIGKGAGGWTIAQATGQTIHVGSTATTAGVGGSVSSSNQYDCITLVCVTANTTFVAYALQGNLTIV